MIRVGIVGTNTSHAAVFAGLLNGTDGAEPVVAGARVVGVWSSGKDGLSGRHADAPELAERYAIERVVDAPEELVGFVDLVLILDDLEGGALHPDLARPFIGAGVPVYIDKPMALRLQDALDLFSLADRSGSPLMSCSALRFAQELDPLRAGGCGDLSAVFSVGPGDWYNYGIHAVEAAVSISGPGATSVLQLHSPDRDLTMINHRDGPRTVIGSLRDARTPFHITAYGADGFATAEISDYQGFYANTMRAAVRMAESGRPAVDRDATLEVLAILEAGQRSAATGTSVEVADVLSAAQR